MRHSRSYDAIEGYADNIMRRAHRGVFAALAVYAVVFAYLCWRLA